MLHVFSQQHLFMQNGLYGTTYITGKYQELTNKPIISKNIFYIFVNIERFKKLLTLNEI